VQAGEAGGVLDSTLDRLARLMERTERVKGRVKAAMTYPVIIIAVAGTILAGLMIFVVPRFEQIFNGPLKGQPFPPLTRAVLGAGDFLGHHIVAVLALLMLLWFAPGLFRKTRAGARFMDWLFIKSPLLGDLLLKAAIARFTRTFGSLLASGVPILNALQITQHTSGNIQIADALGSVHDRIKAGDTVARPLETTGMFPGLVTSMIAIGEETGALPDMLARIADTYDEELDNAVAALTSLIEPLMIVVMAVVVGVIVIALFLPIVGIIQHLQ
jgi:type IV pilus assembly protein PilC